MYVDTEYLGCNVIKKDERCRVLLLGVLGGKMISIKASIFISADSRIIPGSTL